MNDLPHTHPPHDAGGRFDGPVPRTEHEAAHWEKEADAIRMLLSDAKRRLFTTDESRRVQEQLDAETYWAMPYYERWILAFSSLLIEKGLVTEAAVRAEEQRLRDAGLDVVEAHHNQHDDHGHDHDHDHEHHPYQQDHDAAEERLSPLRLRGVAMRNLLLAEGVLTAAEIREEIARMDARSPHNGTAIVVRAWTDAAYAQRLAEDAVAAAAELGLDAAGTKLAALFNTDTRHHLVVCTLCSCYPRSILGRPPAWYKSRAYRARAVRDPRGILAEFGTTLPPGVELRVHDSNAELRYLVVPKRPAGTEGWDAGRLAALVTRDGMIGVTEV
ncbi:nitrile hydratase subunit alpha [Falsiroseomonas sp.]|uniref:nitrile hydratase subunit alpha n=1 Tax=Falsiroseomonas sp. TaxID=2870721 RepID=UPI00272406F7|nr:nitrile hydratase subunit alpha [Falsiroseomonas sp.]MDO9500224.1 nitrile hydratase subunit alpha [Falsiroseomonas sp.]